MKKHILVLGIGRGRNVKEGKCKPQHVLLVSTRLASHQNPVEEGSQLALLPNSADTCTLFVNVFRFILYLNKYVNQEKPLRRLPWLSSG